MEIKTLSTKLLIYKIDECGEVERKLIESAREACLKAYAPYSNYSVGAAILFTDGSILVGNNQENAAYPSGTCAERTALFYAHSQNPNMEIEAIAVTAYTNGEYVQEVCTPCGACRQVMSEFQDKNPKPIRVLMCNKDTVYELGSVKDLLPLSFGFNSMI